MKIYLYNNQKIIINDDIFISIRDFLIQKIQNLLKKNSFCSIALSGGNTPKKLYKILAKEKIEWQKIKFFLVDERILPSGSEGLNQKMLWGELISKLDKKPFFFPPRNLYINPEESVLELEKILKNELPITEDGLPIIDIIFLGVGSDGHTASIFEGTAGFKERKKLVTITEGPPPFTKRITFTFPIIKSAHERWFLVTGKEKKDIINKIFKEKVENLPAKLCSYEPSLWFLDFECAKDLNLY